MSREVEVRVPDIGDFDSVDVVEILVAPGDRVGVEDPLVSLESDKATMEVPSPVAGEVRSVKVALGDAVSEGSLLMVVAASDAVQPEPAAADASAHASPSVTNAPAPASSGAGGTPAPVASQPPRAIEGAPETSAAGGPSPVASVPFASARGVDRPVRAHAAPLVRREARELGVDLAHVEGSGPAGRVLEADLKAYVRTSFERGAPTGGLAAPSRLADVHELETWRRRIPVAEGAAPPSILAVIVKAAVAALRAMPELSGGAAMPVHVGVVSGDDLVVVADAPSLRLRALAALLDGDAPEAGEAHEGASVEPSFRLHHALAGGGAMPTPVCAEREAFALAVGDLEVIPRWSGTPDDALSDGSGARFEPRLAVPLAIATQPDLDHAIGARFLDLWAEILASPARLLL